MAQANETAQRFTITFSSWQSGDQLPVFTMGRFAYED